MLSDVWSWFMIETYLTQGAVHKLRLQEEVGRWSKNVHFLSTFKGRKYQRRGVGGQKKPKSCQRMQFVNDHQSLIIYVPWSNAHGL